MTEAVALQPKPSLLSAGGRRRCLLKIPAYLRSSKGVLPALFNMLIATRRLYGTSLYLERFGRLPDYANPKSYSEKVQWRKLFDRNRELVICCDKLRARRFAAERVPDIGFARILWSGINPSGMPLSKLVPPYVIKPSNRSKKIILVRAPEDVSQTKTKGRCRGWLESPPHNANLYEWGYKRTTGKIIIEEFLSCPGEHDSPPNFKLFVFAGKVRWIFYSDPQHERRGLYSASWEPLDLDRWNRGRRDVFSSDIPAPANLTAIVQAAEAIGAGFDHVRVDLYNIEGRIVFGEMTAYPYGGFATWVRKTSAFTPFPPRDVDDELGSYWELPEVSWLKRLRRGLFRQT